MSHVEREYKFVPALPIDVRTVLTNELESLPKNLKGCEILNVVESFKDPSSIPDEKETKSTAVMMLNTHWTVPSDEGLLVKVNLIPKRIHPQWGTREHPLTSSDLEYLIQKNVINPIHENWSPHVSLLIGRWLCSDYTQVLSPEISDRLSRALRNELTQKGKEDLNRWNMKSISVTVHQMVVNALPISELHRAVREEYTNPIQLSQGVIYGWNSWELVWRPLLFQLMWTLRVFEYVRLVHNDIHFKNILVQRLDKPQDYYYRYKGINFHVRTELSIKIIDFDRAMKFSSDTPPPTNIELLSSSTDDHRNWCTYYCWCNSQYNKYRDLFKILVFIRTRKNPMLAAFVDSIISPKYRTQVDWVSFGEMCEKQMFGKNKVRMPGPGDMHDLDWVLKHMFTEYIVDDIPQGVKVWEQPK